MKSIGIVRRIDDLGRLVLPIELRRVLDLDIGASVEVFTQSDSIVLKKYQPCCIFCGSEKDMRIFGTRSICSGCRKKISDL